MRSCAGSARGSAIFSFRFLVFATYMREGAPATVGDLDHCMTTLETCMPVLPPAAITFSTCHR